MLKYDPVPISRLCSQYYTLMICIYGKYKRVHFLLHKVARQNSFLAKLYFSMISHAISLEGATQGPE